MRAVLIAVAFCCVALLTGCKKTVVQGPPPSSGTVGVSAKANVFAAGRKSVPNLTGGGGTLPERVRVSGADAVTFSSVSGNVSARAVELSKYPLHGPNGGDGPTNVNSYEGISGIFHQDRYLFLAGLFLGDVVPAAPAPERIDFTSVKNLEEVSPQIGQVFYIGDGRNAAGTLQRFVVPNGATRLFLGLTDATAQGQPGNFDDNGGEYRVTYSLSGLE